MEVQWGHEGKERLTTEVCGLCNQKGHPYFKRLLSCCDKVQKMQSTKTAVSSPAQSPGGEHEHFDKLCELLYVGFHAVLCGDFNTIPDIRDRIPKKDMELTREGNCSNQFSAPRASVTQ
ncbi:hypothetical protein MHYP_G00170000 [Metynnis hypsauchen]